MRLFMLEMKRLVKTRRTLILVFMAPTSASVGVFSDYGLSASKL